MAIIGQINRAFKGNFFGKENIIKELFACAKSYGYYSSLQCRAIY